MMHGILEKIAAVFVALKYPNFRLWFIGQVISLVGTWMQSTAQGYLVYELTKSAAYLGIVAFANGLPALLFTMFGGVIADRISKRKMIIITQGTMMVLAFVLALLAFTGWVQAWHIVILAFLLGIVNAFDAPARQSFIVEMVDRSVLTNAIALNSTIFNLGTVIGPTAAGLVYAWLGPAWCFTVNGISFLGVLAALSLMRNLHQVNVPSSGSPLVNLKEGIKYVIGEPRIRLILSYVGVLSIFGFSLLTLMPAWAVEILHGDVRTNGLLLSARGIGSLIGALTVASLAARLLRQKVWLIGWYLMPFCMALFGLIRQIPASLALLVILGWSFMVVLLTSNSLIQTYVPDNLRGRVMGVYTMIFMGSSTIGSLMAGGIADKLGEPVMVYVSAGVVLLAMLATFVFRRIIKEF